MQSFLRAAAMYGRTLRFARRLRFSIPAALLIVRSAVRTYDTPYTTQENT
jgi:hypothetical protein